MNRLISTIQRLSLARDLPTIQAIVKTSARDLANADGASFVLRDNGKCHYADEDAIAPLWKGKRFPMEICVSGWVMLNKKATVIPDIYRDERVPTEAYQPTFVKSLALVPIRTLDPIGAIGVYWATNHNPTDEQISMLQALADSTAVAMENVRVYSELEQRVMNRTADLVYANQEIQKLSITDELTGLMNRRGFRLLAEQALLNAARDKKPVTVFYIDIDGLKDVNDKLGHETGDRMLASAGAIIRSTFRASDIVARVGGDEFCVLAADCPEEPEAVTERLQRNFLSVDSSETRYKLRASIGCSSLTEQQQSLDQLISESDKAMYAIKQVRKSGRAPLGLVSPESQSSA